MPRGTVRAFITLLVITFPLIYLINGEEIPRLIVNAIFVFTAFYFSLEFKIILVTEKYEVDNI